MNKNTGEQHRDERNEARRAAKQDEPQTANRKGEPSVEILPDAAHQVNDKSNEAAAFNEQLHDCLAQQRRLMMENNILKDAAERREDDEPANDLHEIITTLIDQADAPRKAMQAYFRYRKTLTGDPAIAEVKALLADHDKFMDILAQGDGAALHLGDAIEAAIKHQASQPLLGELVKIITSSEVHHMAALAARILRDADTRFEIPARADRGTLGSLIIINIVLEQVVKMIDLEQEQLEKEAKSGCPAKVEAAS